jgi:hypothetical protein
MKFQLRISHYTSNKPPYRGVTLEVIDELSGTHFLQLELTHEQLGRVLGSMSIDCDGDVLGLDRVGLKREVEHFQIPRKKGMGYDKGTVRKYLEKHAKPHEVDGWKVGIEAALSTQQRDPDYYNLHKTRFVPVPEAQTVRAEVTDAKE